MSENIHTKCVVQVRGTTSSRNPQVGLAGGNLQANNPKSEILAQVRGAISHLHKAATAARAFARPRGDVERSETVVSEKNPHTPCVVPPDGETSNEILKVFAEWGRELERENLEGILDVEPFDEEPQP